MRRLAALALLLAASALADDKKPSASAACLECHTAAAARSHPFAVEYNMAARFRALPLKSKESPSGLGSSIDRDLLVDGRVECTSCHVTHAEESTRPSRLRTEKIAALCLACHQLEE